MATWRDDSCPSVGSDELESDVVPPPVDAHDGKLIELVGVMYFAVADPERVTAFFLMPDHTVCCFGTPKVNQIVEVLLPEGVATEYVLDFYLVRGVLVQVAASTSYGGSEWKGKGEGPRSVRDSCFSSRGWSSG